MIPNTTQTPNIIFNGLMRKMNDTEFRIVMLVVRATLGWEADKDTGMRKTEDWISSRQLKEKTGRQSGALSKAIDKCVKEGWIEARSKKGEILDTKGKRKGKNIYFRLGNSILFTTSSESEEVIVKEVPTSSETANAESANAESEDYKRNPIQNKNITKDDAEINSAPVLKKKLNETPMSLQEFMEWCKKSPQRHIQIIGEWAEAVETNYTTKSQWDSFIRRNVRPAKNLIAFTDEQLQEAFNRLQKDIVKINSNTGKKVGFITKFTLETLGKYI